MAELQTIASGLRANLEQTRVEVSIPAKYDVLRNAVADFFGLREALDSLLLEAAHPMRNVSVCATGLRDACSPKTFYYYEMSPERAQCAALFQDLFNDLFAGRPTGAVLSTLVWADLAFVLRLIESEHSDEYTSTIYGALRELREVVMRAPAELFSCSNFVKNSGLRLDGSDELKSRFAEFYAALLIGAYDAFIENVDFRRFFENRHRDVAGHYSEILAAVDAPQVSQLRAAVMSSEDPAFILGQPNFDDLINDCITGVEGVANPVHRTELFAYLANIPDFGSREKDLLRGLHAGFQSVCAESSDDDVFTTFDLVTTFLRDNGAGESDAFWKTLKSLGHVIANRGSPDLAERFVSRVIGFGFVSPGVSGVSDEWEVLRNPQHLRCVRTWMDIVTENPDAYVQLLSALVINIHFRGMFVSDTDLFQRDVTNLLNAVGSESFRLVLQLVRLFPVFFNEIGAEGELRVVSTELDATTNRRDRAVHFLRKQSHAESNNRLAAFAASIMRYWASGERELLREYLPDSIYDTLVQDEAEILGARDVLRAAERCGAGSVDVLLELPASELDQRLEGVAGLDLDKQRVKLLARFYHLLRDKYRFTPELVHRAVERSTLISAEHRQAFVAACRANIPMEVVAAGNQLLLELKDNIIAAEKTEAVEDIYFKRHIAAGIPSMYGTYREVKFDSMGLFLRLTRFLEPYVQRLVDGFRYRTISRRSMHQACDIMRQMLNGLRACGLPVAELGATVEVLHRSISAGNFSAGQYLNLFELVANATDDVVQNNFIAVHSHNLRVITRQLVGQEGEPASDSDCRANQMAEEFLRAIVASTYCLQELDLFLTRILESMRNMTRELDDYSCSIVLNYHPDLLISRLDSPIQEYEDQLNLGYKGFAIKKLSALSLPVPPGFIISTELFDILPALSYEELRRDTHDRIRRAVAQLEAETEKELGNPRRPLLVSVRSGAAFSMPGMLDTIINVGMNDDIAEALSKRVDFGWTSWDCYRRLIQSHAMSSGVSRDVFDQVIVHYKERHRVARKAGFRASEMREIAQEYKRVAAAHGAVLNQDPMGQVFEAIDLVLGSWRSPSAQIYRAQMHIADGWGTAAIVQTMVLGNLRQDSGTGVLFTRDPRGDATRSELFGDYTTASQGEDVVAGLVNPLPISELQRVRYFPGVHRSLEVTHPEIYARLKKIVRQLIHEHGYEHQEIEFTFESPRAEDLYILQARPMFPGGERNVPFLSQPEAAAEHEIGRGVGVSGGVLAGRIVVSEVDIAAYRASNPDHPLILVRPDTVPEDIGLVLEVDGVLTSRGGVTSHASVTAKRLGKTCVVNCRQLAVSETQGTARIGDVQLIPGDWLSIDGHSGMVYEGRQETTEMSYEFSVH